jgi:hypothetical protein
VTVVTATKPNSLPAPVTYRAELAHIRRDSDGLLSLRFGLCNLATGEPVRSDEPGPWTVTDARGITWRHIGRGVEEGNALVLFKDLDAAMEWVRLHGPAELVVGRQRYTFDKPKPQRRRLPGVPRYFLHTIERWCEPKPYLVIDRDNDFLTTAAFVERDEAVAHLTSLNETAGA